MPEYLAPGVYVEEIPALKFLEGVSTSTAAIVGQTSFGPVSGRPAVITSFSEFRSTYGGWDDLVYAGGTGLEATNFTAHAVRAFFDNGGQRIYVSRVFALGPTDDYPDHEAVLPLAAVTPAVAATVRARYPGSWGNQLRVLFKLAPRRSAANLIGKDTAGNPVLRGVYKGAMVQTSSTALADASSPTLPDPSNPSTGTPTVFYVDYVNGVATLFDTSSPPVAQPLPAGAYLVELTAQVFVGDARLPEATYNNLSTGQNAANFIGTFFDPEQPVDDQAMISVTGLATTTDGLQLLRYLCGNTGPTFLAGGDDGHVPAAPDYQGDDDEVAPTGLHAFDRVDDISIVLAADAVSPVLLGAATPFVARYAIHMAINNFLIEHCESLRYRFAVLDEPAASSRNEAIQFRSQFDSSYAGIYYPWIRIVDPRPEEQGRLLDVPPSGSVAGIYARTDVRRGVWKAPANETVMDAVDLEFHIHKGVQDVLNPLAINCLRFFEHGGFRVWGARTLSSDPEWKYVNVRRLFLYIEHSIDKGTQWVVFEPNNEKTWANVKHTIEAFLLDVWKAGALMGTKPEEAYFVKCDRTTMTQNDLANGRLVCVIGVAPAFPAEFVIFRIGQWTADANAS
jgi:phage tail sheath protein FI